MNMNMKKLEFLYLTRKNGITFEVKVDDDFNYYLFVNGEYIKIYKNKNSLYNYVKLNYDVDLMF